MRIVVCVKQVPDTREVDIDPITNTLIRNGLPVIINPDDKSAIEESVKLKEYLNDGSSVAVVSMGPPQAESALREALSMGCDNAYLVSDRKFGGSDTLATSTILAATVKSIGYDVIFTGRQAIDGDTAQVGPGMAEHLDIPHIAYVQKLEYQDGNLIATRQFEDRCHKLQVRPPCLLTAITELNLPRQVHVRDAVDAGKKEVKTICFEDLKEYLDENRIGLAGSPTSVTSSYTKKQKTQGTILKGLTSEQAVEAILSAFCEQQII